MKPTLKDVKEENCGDYIVSWEPSTKETGGGPVTGFQAQVRMENEAWHNCTASSEKRSCLFKGLVNETKYFVRIRAINSKGPSDWIDGLIEAGYRGIILKIIFNSYYNLLNVKVTPILVHIV